MTTNKGEESKQKLKKYLRSSSYDEYVKILKKVPITKTDNPFETLSAKNFPKLRTNTVLDDLLGVGGGITAGQLIEVFGEYGCHSDDTMAVTKDGFKHYSDFKIGDKVLSMNESSHEVEETSIKNIFSYPYDGYLIHFATRQFDFLVTPNHNFLFRMKGASKLRKLSAVKMAESTGNIPVRFGYKGLKTAFFNIYEYIPKKSLKHPEKSHRKNVFPKQINTNDFMELIGWYISEGSIFRGPSSDYVQIRNTTYTEQIRELLTRMNLSFSIYKKGKIVIFHEFLAEYCKRCGDYSHSKHIPQELFDLDRTHLRHLFKSLMLGDGTKTGYQYSTCSKVLRNQILLLGLFAGFTAFWKIHHKIGEKTIINGREIVARHNTFYININRNSKGTYYRNYSLEKFTGRVWCFETENGNFFTYRNKRISLSCNSGKTQVAFTLLAEASQEGTVLVIDSERTWKPERQMQICKTRGLDSDKMVKNLIHWMPQDYQEQLAMIVANLPSRYDLEQEGRPPMKLVVVDSLVSLVDDSRDFRGREHSYPRSGVIRDMLRALRDFATDNQCPVYVTNQVGSVPDVTKFMRACDKVRGVGGHTTRHKPDVVLFFRRAKDPVRIVQLMDSSELPSGERVFMISEKGIEDVGDKAKWMIEMEKKDAIKERPEDYIESEDEPEEEVKEYMK